MSKCPRCGQHEFHEFEDVMRELLEMKHDLRKLLRYDREILEDVQQHNLTHFTIQRTNPMNPVEPGTSPQYVATPVPAGDQPLTPPTWTTSDSVNAPISVDPTGLICTVNVPKPAAAVSYTLTVDYKNPDGTDATGTITDTIVVPVLDITSFTIARTV
jgi:hypothetical protein